MVRTRWRSKQLKVISNDGKSSPQKAPPQQRNHKPYSKSKNIMQKHSAFEKELKCSICLDTCRRKKMKSLPCKHEFHQICVDKWLKRKKKCPLCREPILRERNLPNNLNGSFMANYNGEGMRGHLIYIHGGRIIRIIF
ncbi:hypothetical protein TNIN_399221 [Trichonephila inaurata madagascariensis]|uniref:RING-type domain-containing protein n=1 Tax=Trichonephila inaurata madagascariensis TaxID=2747483 RepID=A0A8X6XKV6_9ARAC|nr:hypothetical protein TNIN_399221 [Trichonephila inaurata madagascariensis]